MTPTTASLDKPSIPTSYSLLLAAELGLQERSLGALLIDSHIDAEQLTSDTTLLTAEQQVQIIRNALRLLGDTGLGLRLGKRLTPPTHGTLGFLANSSPDLNTAIKAFQEFLPTRMCFVRLNVDADERWLRCNFTIELQAEEAVYRSLIEAVSLALLSIIEFVLGRTLTEGRLCLDYPPPAYANLYSDYIPCLVNF